MQAVEDGSYRSCLRTLVPYEVGKVAMLMLPRWRVIVYKLVWYGSSTVS